MRNRINIVLPETTVRAIARLAKPGERSRFIDRAVQHYVATRSTEALRARLEKAAIRDRDLDHQVAEDWLAVDRETWERLEATEKAKKPATRVVGKSSSLRSTLPSAGKSKRPGPRSSSKTTYLTG